MRQVIALVAIAAALASAAWAVPAARLSQAGSVVQVTRTEIEPGVTKWVAASANPRFFDLLRERTGATVSSRPFGRSVAVLAGVSQYTRLKALPGVAADLERVRLFLLDIGFDEVWVINEKAVTLPRLMRTLQGRSTLNLRADDRVLFYYAGHGVSSDGQGYIQLTDATPESQAEHVIPMVLLPGWLRALNVRHALFVLDTCSAGLSVQYRSEESPTLSILKTLSNSGSRVMMTAGTGSQRTPEVIAADGKPAGAFTMAWLMASRSVAGGVFATGEQIFAELKVRLARLLVTKDLEQTNPRWVPYDEELYKGAFLFVTPGPVVPLQPDEARLLGVTKAADALPAVFPTSNELVFELGDSFVRGASRMAVDLGVVGNGQVIDLIFNLQNESASPRVLQLDRKTQAIVANWEGGTWTTVAEPRALKKLNVRVHVDQLKPSDTLDLVGKAPGGEETSVARISFPITDKRELQVARERSSPPTPSGAFSAFSGPHRLCLGPAPPGYSLVPDSASFWLTGDRQCGAWATCDWEQRDDQDVCFAFRLQGHSEDPRDLVQPRTSTGYVRAQYRLRWANPPLRALKE